MHGVSPWCFTLAGPACVNGASSETDVVMAIPLRESAAMGQTPARVAAVHVWAHGHVSSSFFACGVFASQVSGWRTGVDDHAPAVLLHHQKKPSGLVS
jgi:hypothetical protein